MSVDDNDEVDDGLLSPERLAGYDVPGAPAEFAARVARAAAVSSVPRRLGARWLVVGALAAAAVVALVVLGGGQARGGSGERLATARETIAVAERGVAVVQPGTDLEWTVADTGDAVVEQRSGKAFYRVERGGPFQVKTALGVVSVTGTCFSVEVEMSKQDVAKGAAGALIAVALVVTVYEGGVTLANPSGQSLRLAAGDVGEVKPGAAPVARGAQLAAGAVGAVGTDAELVAARAKIRTLEAELGKARADETNDDRAEDPGRYYAPSLDTLRKMAQTCTIAYDQPGLDTEARPVLIDGELAGAAGLAEGEQDAVNQAYLVVHDRAVDEIRRLYMELTGQDANAAAALSVKSLGQEIVAKTPPEEEVEARRRIARERAQLDPTPTAEELAHRPIVERYLRIMMRLGSDAETAAAKVVGAARAHELRTRNHVGWNSTVSDYGSCEPGHL